MEESVQPGSGGRVIHAQKRLNSFGMSGTYVGKSRPRALSSLMASMAITAPTVWLDGKLVAKEAATAPLMGHAIQRGSLVFDVGSFHAGTNGPVLFRAR